MKSILGYFLMAIAAILAASGLTDTAHAQTDLAGTVTSVSTLWTSVETVAISVLVFVVGRRFVRKV